MSKWQRLGRDETARIIESVKSSENPGLFSATSCEVERSFLPFYTDFDLYRITNYASLPSFTFHFVGDGTFFDYLDGTEDPIIAVNHKGNLNLTENRVVDYLSFYFSHVETEDGEQFLVQDPYDMPLLKSLDSNSAKEIIRNHKPPAVQHNGQDQYNVTAELYSEGQLSRAEIDINSQTGRVMIGKREMILNAVQANETLSALA